MRIRIQIGKKNHFLEYVESTSESQTGNIRG